MSPNMSSRGFELGSAGALDSIGAASTDSETGRTKSSGLKAAEAATDEPAA